MGAGGAAQSRGRVGGRAGTRSDNRAPLPIAANPTETLPIR